MYLLANILIATNDGVSEKGDPQCFIAGTPALMVVPAAGLAGMNLAATGLSGDRDLAPTPLAQIDLAGNLGRGTWGEPGDKTEKVKQKRCQKRAQSGTTLAFWPGASCPIIGIWW